MIRLKSGELVPLLKTIAKLYSADLPIKLSYSISRIIEILNQEHKLYSNEMQKIIDKYGERDENGNPIIENGFIKLSGGFEKDLDEINNIYIEIAVGLPENIIGELIKYDVLLSAQDINNIEKIVAKGDN